MKNKLLDKIVFCTFPIVGTIFIIALFAFFWGFVLENKLMVLLISGGIIFLFALLGYFNKKKFIRGIKRKFR